MLRQTSCEYSFVLSLHEFFFLHLITEKKIQKAHSSHLSGFIQVYVSMCLFKGGENVETQTLHFHSYVTTGEDLNEKC